MIEDRDEESTKIELQHFDTERRLGIDDHHDTEHENDHENFINNHYFDTERESVFSYYNFFFFFFVFFFQFFFIINY